MAAWKVIVAQSETSSFAIQQTILIYYLKGTHFYRNQFSWIHILGFITEININGRGISDDLAEINFSRCC